MIDIHHLPGSTLDEHEITVYRRHSITLVPTLLSALFVFLIPPFGYTLLSSMNPAWFELPANMALFVIGASLFFLFGLLFIFQTFLEYWLDVFILTDKRILDIDQTGLFKRTVSESRLYRTQDVTSEIKGFLHSMLDYGDVYVQTAAEVERFHFADVAHPNELAKKILELSERDREGHMEEAMQELNMPDSFVPKKENGKGKA